MKKILIIKAHPREVSLCNALADQYVEGAKNAGAEIKILSLKDLKLEEWLKYDWGHNHDSVPSSNDIKYSQELVSWSNHIVFTYPIYWAMPPALLSLFFEMIMTSSFAFKYHKPLFGIIPVWDKLLKGRTASIISTMDAPPFFMELYDQDPSGKMIRDVLRFAGVKLKHKHYFGSVVMSSQSRKEKWLDKAYKIGQKEGR